MNIPQEDDQEDEEEVVVPAPVYPSPTQVTPDHDHRVEEGLPPHWPRTNTTVTRRRRLNFYTDEFPQEHVLETDPDDDFHDNLDMFKNGEPADIDAPQESVDVLGKQQELTGTDSPDDYPNRLDSSVDVGDFPTEKRENFVSIVGDSKNSLFEDSEDSESSEMVQKEHKKAMVNPEGTVMNSAASTMPDEQPERVFQTLANSTIPQSQTEENDVVEHSKKSLLEECEIREERPQNEHKMAKVNPEGTAVSSTTPDEQPERTVQRLGDSTLQSRIEGKEQSLHLNVLGKQQGFRDNVVVQLIGTESPDYPNRLDSSVDVVDFPAVQKRENFVSFVSNSKRSLFEESEIRERPQKEHNKAMVNPHQGAIMNTVASTVPDEQAERFIQTLANSTVPQSQTKGDHVVGDSNKSLLEECEIREERPQEEHKAAKVNSEGTVVSSTTPDEQPGRVVQRLGNSILQTQTEGEDGKVRKCQYSFKF